MSVWQLNRDILHSIYSEWLRWDHLPRLDIACIEKTDREEWLSSLIDLRMRGSLKEMSRSRLKKFYMWLNTRQVFCVEEFPVRLEILRDLMEELNWKSHCPIIRSIKIVRGELHHAPGSYNLSLLEWNLSVFIRLCHGLQGVVISSNTHNNINDNNNTSPPQSESSMDDIVFRILDQTLQENSLIKIDLKNFTGGYNKYGEKIANLLRRHASSLEELHLSVVGGVGMNLNLIENQLHLKTLVVYLWEGGLHANETWFIPYLASGGGRLLETLQVKYCAKTSLSIDHLLVSIAVACPKLTRLIMQDFEPGDGENLRHLFELCPHLQYVTFDGIIKTDEKRRSVSIEVRGSNGEWAKVLCLALRRSQYMQATLELNDRYHRVENLKFMLEPYQLRLDSATREVYMIALLEDLPHLNSLNLSYKSTHTYTDATLAAITKHHATSLTALKIADSPHNCLRFRISDKVLSELIQACQLLQILNIIGCGLKSFVAVSNHTSLREVDLTAAHNVLIGQVDALLLDENIEWPLTLEEGIVSACGSHFYYSYDTESCGWGREKY
eukprot:scaffold1594_cov171-Ochromonas_danica.AAC.19